MTQDIRETNCWSEKYQLPICPNHYNPHIYLGYIYLIDSTAVNNGQYAIYFNNCCRRGVFYRFPDGTQGEGSWDEVIGAASIPICVNTADWFLNNFRLKWHRFIFLKCYLKACAYGPDAISWWDRLLFSTYIRLSIKGNLVPGDVGGRLRSWLMISKTGLMKDYWNERMVGAGYTLKGSLQIEPGDNPWLAENAPNSWF